MQVLSALDTLKESVSRHVDAINKVVTPILEERDIISTCTRYLALVRDDSFPREYGHVRGVLEGELITEPRPQEPVRDKIKAVLSELGRFQYAALMLEYDSFHMSDHVRFAQELWSLLSEQNHLQPSPRIADLQTRVGMGFKTSFQWLKNEQENWLPAKQRQQISVADFELNTPNDVVDLVAEWCKQWQRHVQMTLYGGRGLDYAIAQLEMAYEVPGQAGEGPNPETIGIDRAKLRRNIAAYFSKDDLRTLCFELGIKDENLAADTLDGMARELVSYCERTGKIRELVAECRKWRPNTLWE